MPGFKEIPSALVLVASADTVISRNIDLKNNKLLVVDEAHMAVNGKVKKIVEDFPNFIIAVTATPYGKESLTHLAETVVRPVTTMDLINKGHLVNAKYFSPSLPDLKGIRSQCGDYNLEDLEKRMAPLTGDILHHWKTLGQNRPTLCFAVNVAHSKKIVENFNNNNIPAIHLDANDSLEIRNSAIAKLKTGEIKIISNVGVMGTGVDIEFLSCIIVARPTKSYNLHIQQLGRGTRPYENKTDFIVLDHAGNAIRHGFITQERDVSLTGSKKQKIKAPSMKICSECYLVFQGILCPGCGHDSSPKPTNYEISGEGTLVALTEDYGMNVEISMFIAKIKRQRELRGYKKGWLYHTVKNKYGEAIAARAFPRLHVQAQYASNRNSSSTRERSS